MRHAGELIDGDFVRYRVGGPRIAQRGCIGLLAEPTERGRALGWLRAGFFGSYDDYDASELEPARFWAFLSTGDSRWRGPFEKWDQAAEAVAAMLREATDFPAAHPLADKRDQLVADLTESDPVHLGIVGYHPSTGEARIVVAGEDQPSLHDKAGKRRF